MSNLDERFYEDRALRNAAREVFLADLAHVKDTLSGKGLAGRLVDRVGEGAQDVIEVAKNQAEDKRGILAALIGAILLWISREPIFEILGLTEPTEDEDTSPDEPADDSDSALDVTPPGEDDDR